MEVILLMTRNAAEVVAHGVEQRCIPPTVAELLSQGLFPKSASLQTEVSSRRLFPIPLGWRRTWCKSWERPGLDPRVNLGETQSQSADEDGSGV